MASPVTFRTNIFSLRAAQQLTRARGEQDSIATRLSSGQRINRASDDASSLAIASSLGVKERIYSRAILNINDGLSLLNIADATVQELTGIVTRIKELAQQSANGVYTTSQRSALHKEAQELQSEYSRLTDSAKFNGTQVFNSASTGLSLQAGFGVIGDIGASLSVEQVSSGPTGDGTFGTDTNIGVLVPTDRYSFGDLTGDGAPDTVYFSTSGWVVYENDGAGSFSASSTVTLPTPASSGVGLPSIVDLNNDGHMDLVGEMTIENGALDDRVFASALGNGDGTFQPVTTVFLDTTSTPYASSVYAEDFNGDGYLDAAIVGLGFLAYGNGDGTFSSPVNTTMFTLQQDYIGDVSGDGKADLINIQGTTSPRLSVSLGNGDGTFSVSYYNLSGLTAHTYGAGYVVGDFDGDGNEDVVSQMYNGGVSSLATQLGNGDGTFQSHFISSSSVQDVRHWNSEAADFNGDGNLDIVFNTWDSPGSGAITMDIHFGNGDGTFTTGGSYSTTIRPSLKGQNLAVSDLNGDGALDIAGGGYNALFGAVSSDIPTITTDYTDMPSLSLLSRSDALTAIETADSTLEALNSSAGRIGSSMSRLFAASENLRSQAVEFKAAESRIMDVDVAEAAADLLKIQILENVGAAVLAQANQLPELLLKLLSSS